MNNYEAALEALWMAEKHYLASPDQIRSAAPFYLGKAAVLLLAAIVRALEALDRER